MAKDNFIFISYSSKNISYAQECKKVFEAQGISCWMAPDSIPPGKDFAEEITSALMSENCKGFLILLSEDSQNSRHVRREIGIADENSLPIFPVLLEGISLNETYRYLLTNVQFYRIQNIAALIAPIKQLCYNEDSNEVKTKPLFTRKGAFVLFGEYPQSIKESSIQILDQISQSKDIYIGSDGHRYLKKMGNPYEDGYHFSNGTLIKEGVDYFFKFEPLKWRILREQQNEILLLCESIIDNIPWGAEDNNNYAQSKIRLWANSIFYNDAFSKDQKAIIAMSTVLNSASTTEWDDNPNISADTTDKVFLLSYQDLITTKYGFCKGSSRARLRLVSDFARCKGAWISMDDEYEGYGWWWLRSPRAEEKTSACTIYLDSFSLAFHHVKSTCGGFVPALTIKKR